MADAFIVKFRKDLEPATVLRWGHKHCAQLFLSRLRGENEKILVGLWKTPATESHTVVRNRLRGNLRTWGILEGANLKLVNRESYNDVFNTLEENPVDILATASATPLRLQRTTVSTVSLPSGPPEAARHEDEESQQETNRCPSPFIFDPAKKLLALGGEPVRVVEDSLGNAWFQAKPMVVFLEYTHITNTLERLDPEDVKSLEALLSPQITQNFGYHDKKALYINEPGVYDLILGSQKPQAMAFKYWITHKVMPEIRRTGCYRFCQEGGELQKSEVFPTDPVPKRTITARIGEPFLNWRIDIGAERKEIPAAKAMLKTLFEIEVAAGALPRSPAPNYAAPQTRFRELVHASLASSRVAIQKRIGTMAAGNTARKRTMPSESKEDEEGSCSEPGDGTKKRARNKEAEDEKEEELLHKEANEKPLPTDDILKVSEVMRQARVWEPVWKTYMPDLSNRMLQIKSEETDGAFSERRLQQVAGGSLVVSVHKYKNPDDWPVACRALVDTKSLYEKRLRELLEDAFLRAELYSDTLSRTCSEAARRIAAQLNTDIT